jgi:hypothetical protein
MDKKTINKKAGKILRNYLIRCHESISADYPETEKMPPENAADYLIHLRDTGRIAITLDTVDDRIVCHIEDLN